MVIAFLLAALITPSFALDATGSPNYAMVRGVVTDGKRPVGNVPVMAYGDADVRETRTDAAGRYYFMALLPGEYRIFAVQRRLAVISVLNGTVVSAYPGPNNYAGLTLSKVRECLTNDQRSMELSAGQLYLANIDLQPSPCR